jgi:hypothetical protein
MSTPHFAEAFTRGLVVALKAISEENGDSFSPSVMRYSQNSGSGHAPHINLWQSQEASIPSESHGGLQDSLTITGIAILHADPHDLITTADEIVSNAKHDMKRAIIDYVLSNAATQVEFREGFSLTFTPIWELEGDETEIGVEFILEVSYGLSHTDLSLVNPY